MTPIAHLMFEYIVVLLTLQLVLVAACAVCAIGLAVWSFIRG